MNKSLKYVYAVLVLAVVGIWLALFASPDNNFHLIACDVGQGDAILATYRNIQILTDGGPDNRVLDCLSEKMPFWDREIELVILTHPDKDHFSGLIEVVRRYKVDNFLYNDLESGKQEYQVLKNDVGGRGIRSVVAKEGTVIRFDKIQLDILNPMEDISNLSQKEKGEENEYSVVTLLTFGGFDALLTGDVEGTGTDAVADRIKERGKQNIEYIKVPHHGSKNGLTQKLLEVVVPKLAAISVGKNSYGHPHEETLKILGDRDIRILRTDKVCGGRPACRQAGIEVVSDGKTWWVVE